MIAMISQKPHWKLNEWDLHPNVAPIKRQWFNWHLGPKSEEMQLSEGEVEWWMRVGAVWQGFVVQWTGFSRNACSLFSLHPNLHSKTQRVQRPFALANVLLFQVLSNSEIMDATVGSRGGRESSWAYKQREELKCVFRGETARKRKRGQCSFPLLQTYLG